MADLPPKSLKQFRVEATGPGCPKCACVDIRDGVCRHCGHGRRVVPAYHSGDRCPATDCSGRLIIATTKPDNGDGLRTRYFECKECGQRCSCEVEAASVHSPKVR